MNTEYAARIRKVIDYIERNLNSKMPLSELADVSHFSEFHFHRVFKGVMNETVNDYVSRRRLEHSVNLLVCKPTLSVTQIALDNGFSSSANFSKAIKLHFGYSPSEIRNPNNKKSSKIGKVFSKYGKAFNPNDLYPTRITNEVMPKHLQDINMNVEVRNLKSQRVCCLPSKGGYASEAIYEAWDKLIGWATANGIKPNQQKRFAFCYDNPTVTPIDKCRYEASIVVDELLTINTPFAVSEIPEGKYAVLHYKGTTEDSIKAQLGLYSDWLPDSGFEPDDFPMLENYLNDARVDGYIEMEIYVKLKAL